MSVVSPAKAPPSNRRWRLLALAALALGEIFLASFSFTFTTGLPEWINPVAYAKALAQVGLLTVGAFALIAWPQRARIAAVWDEAAQRHQWLAALAVNLGLFAVLLVAGHAFTRLAEQTSQPPWSLFALYCGQLLLVAISLAALAAPAAFWSWLARRMPTEGAVALLSAMLLVLAGELSQESWTRLSGATLGVSHWFLSLYETDVILDVQRQLLGAGDFSVIVTQECSGYEGIGLVTAFTVLYFWLMRKHLRFPNVLVLIPAALAAVWALNALRIALLVSVGRHLSPEVAINGFHSQAGWIGFLTVAVGTMALAHTVPLFRAAPRERRAALADANQRLLHALLVPFIALTATSIVASLFAPHDQWLYLLKIVAVGGALWAYRDVYARFASAVSPLSLIVGLGVGMAWIATDPGEGGDRLGAWLAGLPVWVGAAWLACRALGAIVLVPITEELAFRGFLQRALVKREFATVAPGQFTWLSFVATSVMFGMVHQRFVAAALAGAIYALLVYRSGRLSDAIGAHIATNAVIVAWAISMQQWSLL
jgi:exosortase E/protease (VPEID-CTERM system)